VATGKSDLLQGTLDLLILRTLSLGPLHGYGVSQRLQQLTRGVFHVNAGPFFPARLLPSRPFVDGGGPPSGVPWGSRSRSMHCLPSSVVLRGRTMRR